jgi:GH15 family glucan-1,4-alpha-glucosidase
MCWVAADRGARLAEIRGELEHAARWQSSADEIGADICAHALDERGVFCQHYGTTALDASVLLMPLVRFLPPDDERIRKTVFAIADELTVDGLVLRYRTEETDDGLSDEEGAFTICSSGSSLPLSRSERWIGHATSARSFSPTPARSSSTPRRSTAGAGATSAMSRKHSPTSR